MAKKIVLYPIEVPTGNHCWEWYRSICRNFDNSSGSSVCLLGFRIMKGDNDGVVKPDECANLQEEK